MPEPRERRQSLQSLERGIAVIQVFSRERPALTLREVARLTGITRATARRILLTLEDLGHVRSDGRLFSLTPRVLTLGWAYLSSLNLWEIAQPLMEESTSRPTSRARRRRSTCPTSSTWRACPTRRIMTIALGVGTRLPAHCTSMGRVLLAALPERRARAYLAERAARALHRADDHRPRALRRRSTRCASRAGRWSTRSSRSACARRRAAAGGRPHDRRDQRLGGGAPGAARAASSRALPPRAAQDGRPDRHGARAPARPAPPAAPSASSRASAEAVTAV